MSKVRNLRPSASKPVKDLKSDQEKPNITGIAVTYDDGTEKGVRKGAIVEMSPKGGETTISIEFKDITGSEAVSFFEGMFVLCCQVLKIDTEDDAIDVIDVDMDPGAKNNPNCITNDGEGYCTGTDEPCNDCVADYGDNETE